MPPPNVTGGLHNGHMLFVTLEDIMIHCHGMLGDPSLWVPGRDHAGIAGQLMVERDLAQRGISRHDMAASSSSTTLGSGRRRTAFRSSSSCELRRVRRRLA